MKAELADLAAALGGGVFTDPGAAAAEVAAQLDHAEERLATLRVRSMSRKSITNKMRLWRKCCGELWSGLTIAWCGAIWFAVQQSRLRSSCLIAHNLHAAPAYSLHMRCIGEFVGSNCCDETVRRCLRRPQVHGQDHGNFN